MSRSRSNMSAETLARDNLPILVQSAENKPLQPPENTIYFNRHRLVEFTGNLQTNIDSQKTGWDTGKEIKRFIGDVNLGLIKGLTLKQAVAFSTQIFTDHICFYDAEFIKQEPVLPHRNYFGIWQGRERWLGNNGRPVVDGVDDQERMGSVKRATKKTEECLLEAENNSFIVSTSSKGASGYLDENGCDVPHLNTYTMVEWKDEDGNLKGITLVTDLTVEQAEKVMEGLGAPTNLLSKRGTEMQRVADILENPVTVSCSKINKNPFEFVFDRILAVRGEEDIRLHQKSGQDEIRSVAEVKQKIASFDAILDLNGTKERLIREFQEFVLANYQQVENPSLQQKIIDMAEETVLLFAKYHRLQHPSDLLTGLSTTLSQYANHPTVDDREIVRLREGVDRREYFRAEMDFLQSRAGCPSSRKSSSGSSSAVAGGSGLGESDSKGSLYFPCPVCGAINKRPREGYVSHCQSCGTDKVACESPGTVEKKQEEVEDKLPEAA